MLVLRQITKLFVLILTSTALALVGIIPAAAQQITGTPGAPSATTTIDGRKFRRRRAPFGGTINLDALQSKPYWQPQVVPPKGAPNVLLIMTDDVGFRRAEHLRRRHPDADARPHREHGPALHASSTRRRSVRRRAPRSSPAATTIRSASASSARHRPAIPGYDSVITADKATIGTILKDNGYATSWFGKDHNTPSFQTSQVGSLRPMAERHGLRIFLRLHRRRDQPVAARPLPQHHAHLSLCRQSRLEPDDGHGGRRHRLSQSAQRSSIRRSRSSSTMRRAAPMRRIIRPRSGSRRSAACISSTRAGTRCATRSSPTRRGSASIPQDAQLTPWPDKLLKKWDDALRRREEALHPPGGRLRGLPRLYRPRDRPRDPGGRGHGQARQHADHLHQRRQWRERRRLAGRHAERDDLLQRRRGAGRRISSNSTTSGDRN